MPSYVTPKRATAYVTYIGLVDQADTKKLKANPTIAAGDFKVSIDGGAFANLATLPTVTPASGTAVKISLSSGEMTGDNIIVTAIDAAGAEWCDQLINIATSARQIDDLSYPATSGRSTAVDASGRVDANTVQVAGQTASAAGAVTFPDTIASTTNITGGTITTVTNLTNAPTAGDLTATMKTSVTTAATAATPALSAGGIDAIHDDVFEGSLTFRQIVRLMASVLLGKASGLATSTAVYRDLGDTKDRITATVDADGNRSAVTRDGT